jgi:hypothetical protein
MRKWSSFATVRLTCCYWTGEIKSWEQQNVVALLGMQCNVFSSVLCREWISTVNSCPLGIPAVVESARLLTSQSSAVR